MKKYSTVAFLQDKNIQTGEQQKSVVNWKLIKLLG